MREARRVIRLYELRDGHAAYAMPLGGGYRGYQGRCHDCQWEGAEHLRGDEEMGTEASREHKRNARAEAEAHRKQTIPAGPESAP